MATIKREQERVNHGEGIQGIIDEVCYNKRKNSMNYHRRDIMMNAIYPMVIEEWAKGSST